MTAQTTSAVGAASAVDNPDNGAISDFDFDSSGSLSSLDSFSSDNFSDASNIGDILEDLDSACLFEPPSAVEPANIPGELSNLEPPASPQPVAAPPKRKRGRSKKTDAAGSSKLRSSSETTKSLAATLKSGRAASSRCPRTLPTPSAKAEKVVTTTGAFFTRATLRQLGVANCPAGPATNDSSAVGVGGRVKVLSLDKKWYAAVILVIKAGKVLIHYPGWDHSYNEWIHLDSRRLQYKGKLALGVGESSGVSCLADGWSEGSDVDMDFDIQQAIQDALNMEMMVEDGDDHLVDINPDLGTPLPVESATAIDPQLAEDQPRPRGRPPSTKTRKRANRTKKKPNPKSKANTSNQAASPTATQGSVGACDSTEGKEPGNAAVEAPQVPKEFRIPTVRVIRGIHNPYAKFPRPEDILSSDSEDTGTHGMADADSSAVKTQDSGEASKTNSENTIWHLNRGPYVTTGAFLTRRTVKCLAHNESLGGIMQDHHGYYPGQLVEVMNANRTWYVGRVISYADKKFLVHYMDWGHSHNEWLTAGSRRMRRLSDRRPDIAETEEEARKTCATLVDEYNAYIDELERKKQEKEKARQRRKPPRKPPANARTNELAAEPLAGNSEKQEQPAGDEGDSDVCADVEPISVENGYSAMPQLARIKDYTKIYRKCMKIAARDRDGQWWKAEIVEVKSFQIRVHYTGFSERWDEWMEMNTQRIMCQDEGSSGPADSRTGSIIEAGSGTEGDRTSTLLLSGPEDQRPAGSRSHDRQDSNAARPAKRLGRPPGPETQSAPLSLRLALKSLMKNHEMYEQCHPEDAGVFRLPKEHMTTKDYTTFLQIGDKVRIRDRDKQWYTCTIINVRHGHIRVCFDGHPEEYNQWIAFNSDRIRVLRETIEGGRRLEKLERESQIALRRKREKMRARKRQRSQAAMASLAKIAESLEYIVDQSEAFMDADSQAGGPADDAVGSSDPEDTAPLLQRMLRQGSGPADSMPLIARLFLPKYLSSQSAREGACNDSATWFVYCNQCNVVIHTFRYYCTACEKPSDGYDYESFDLCLMCFSQRFPHDHPHPRFLFARKPIDDVESIVKFTSNVLKSYHGKEQALDGPTQIVDLLAGLVAAYEPDSFDMSYDAATQRNSLWRKLAIGLHGTTTATTFQTKCAVFGRIARFSSRSYILNSIDTEDSADGSADGADGRSAKTASQKLAECIPRCAFCGDEDPNDKELGGFASSRPFILTSHTEDGAVKRRRFWTHYACAKYSPEVLVSESGQWYNVAAALKRARTIKCAGCKQRGATIGCFHDRCQKSYHVACTGKPISYFEDGCIFWCRRHARDGAQPKGRDGETPGNSKAYSVSNAAPTCATCSRELAGDLMWMVCLECPSEPLQQFNICLTCYESKDGLAGHPHKKRCFREHLSHTGGVTSTGQYIADGESHAREKAGNPGSARASCCHYCRRTQSRRWRKGYGGVVMCEPCFKAAHTLDGTRLKNDSGLASLCDQDIIDDDGDTSGQMEVVALNPFGNSAAAIPDSQHSALVEDYTQNVYFTRETCVASNRIGAPAASQQPLGQLSSYGPTDSMLFTLIVDSSYFDIPGRAPRWGSHSGTDYHGTWLPQTVRRALLRYTRRGERVLSNFLGRGTDAIECFMLSRKCIGVDINPSAVSLSQRNCSFTILPDSDMSVEYRPVIMQGDSRNLCSESWPGAPYFAEPESYDHVLSHPPYKDCVLYSTNIEGDLSRFPGPEEFQKEMRQVIADSWRLLKTGRHLTLGIGDNRAECFYIPVSYQLIRNYINCGFELDELIVKRQRYCQAFGLGTYLCVQFDFLMFTHEFIATLRKVPKDKVNTMYLTAKQYEEDARLGFHCPQNAADGGPGSGGTSNMEDKYRVEIKGRVLRAVPASPIERNSVVMGSVWTFEPHAVHSFPQLCMSRMVERFGRDNSNWEHIDVQLSCPASSKSMSMSKEHENGDQRREWRSLRDSGNGSESASASSDGQSESDSEHSASDSDHNPQSSLIADYERERLRQIQRNREELLQLGLVSELGEDTTDIAHYRKMIVLPPKQPIPETPLGLVVVPHIPETQFLRGHVESYRQALVQITHDVSHRLSPSGLLVIGIQDVRDEHGKLWPLGMLVLEDVQSAVGEIRLRLKEFVVVVEQGHARKRDDVVSRESFADEPCVVGSDSTDVHIPIVHAYYLVFMKLK
ncbi:hypothetical protein GQ54DRAFT_334987 [Martensiomyces pterosporus]|nr:hypothetical protein GQ54DRAFT_334987 [Martensiomyces pterosporus]